MNQKMFQTSVLGFLILFAISTESRSEDVKTWVKEDQRAGQAAGQTNDQLPTHAYGPFATFLATTGVTTHQLFKGDGLRDQARKAISKGDRNAAERLLKKAERSEGIGGMGMFLVLPTAIIAINKEMDVQAKRSKLADEREARQMGKARAAQQMGGDVAQKADSRTENVSAY